MAAPPIELEFIASIDVCFHTDFALLLTDG